MNNFNINVVALAVSLAFSAGAMAEGMSKDDYKAGKDRIAAEYKVAKVGCDSFSANAKDICVAEAKGKAAVGKAELRDIYAVAKEKCDTYSGDAKHSCMKQAKADFGKS